ncbi:hypothetical protein MHM83_13505 [Tenacibaculum sp. Mcav3-52]|uniref:hypothetical protein n=1 Tax=Tenacibaculum sp. Mcav3-52 TaxID=2917762 RepID=UPI001EF1ED67|nr:hypothetical protein [Tenacibaculum sp. Mcav3-52]MCG7502880.1 hypothetical protein [Tenacibaculum sp. Mcav3-52]
MRKISLILLIFSSYTSFACSCSQLRLTNTLSGIEFVGIIKFTSLKKIEKFEGIYKAEYKVKEQFIGYENAELFIESQEGSSCGFLPELNSEYFIFAYQNELGFLATSFCLARNIPNKEILSILREITQKRIYQQTTRNIRQLTKEKLNSNLFEQNINGAFIYEAILDSNFKVKRMKPFNLNARKNFNEKIKQELNNKFEYKRMNEDLKMKEKNFKIFIILNWNKNYEGKLVVEPTKV